MNGFTQFFLRPHPFNYKGRASLASGLIVFLLLFFLKPFSFGEPPVLTRFTKALTLGGVTAGTLAVSYLLASKSLHKRLPESRWFIGHDLLFSAFNMVLIGTANVFTIYLLNWSEAPLAALLVRVVPNTFYVGFVASFLLLFLEQSLHLSAELKTLEQINDGLRASQKSQPTNTETVLVSENEQPELKLNIGDILYVKSEGNYLDIYHFHSGQVQKELLRNRLKYIRAILPEAVFFSCHRSYIINLNYLIKVSRGSRDHELTLKRVNERIPVSRAKVQELKRLLTA